jgi:hypothetical protein
MADSDYISAQIKQFESGSRGPDCYAQCGKDWGRSFGTYQMTCRWGNAASFLKEYFPDQATGLYYNGPDKATSTWPGASYGSGPDEIQAVWEACVKNSGRARFQALEREHIRRNYYEPLLKKLANLGFNPNTHSRAAQECMWSWAVNRGYAGAEREFKAALSALGTARPQTVPVFALLEAMYDARYKVQPIARYDKTSGASSERCMLLARRLEPPLVYTGTSPGNGKGTGVFDMACVDLPELKKGAKDPAVKRVQARLNELGYKDAAGKPLIVDGSFGGGTDYAFRAWQKADPTYRALGGKPDGICGEKAWTALLIG